MFSSNINQLPAFVRIQEGKDDSKKYIPVNNISSITEGIDFDGAYVEYSDNGQAKSSYIDGKTLSKLNLIG